MKLMFRVPWLERRAPTKPHASAASGPKSQVFGPELPREHLLEAAGSRRAANPITALVQRIQDSPASTAVLIGSMGGVVFLSLVPREAVALIPQDTRSVEPTRAPPVDEETFASADERVAELKRKVGSLVERKFGGDFKVGFNHYDRDQDGGIGRTELMELLDDAGVGNMLTRGRWADGVLNKIDRELGNDDGRIQWHEFQALLVGAA